MSQEIKIYLIAGEPSGDLLGSRFMRALKKRYKRNIHFYGVGGETMEAEGLRSLFDIKDLAVMGFMEVLPSIPRILTHLKNIISDIQKIQPDIVMTIDSYSFSARVHQRLKKIGYQKPHVHYVAPQVWAWKKGRAKKIGHFVDHLYCLLPNEEAYFTPYGCPTTFIGHPVVEGGADKGDKKAFYQKYKIPKKATVLCVLPGSRKNEIRYLVPIFKESVEILKVSIPNLFIVIPTVKTVSQKLKEDLKDWNIPHLIITGEKERYNAFSASKVALAASGTVSLELAMAGVPHLIAYKVSPLTGAVARRLLKIRFVNLLNILANKEIIPELLQENCTSSNIVNVLKRLLKNPKQSVKPSLTKIGLGAKELPSEKLALEIQKLLQKEKK